MQLAKNSADDEANDWRNKCIDLDDKLAQLRSELNDEKLRAREKLEQLSLEHRQELETIRENFEREKVELFARCDEKCSKLDLECSGLKEQVPGSGSPMPDFILELI